MFDCSRVNILWITSASVGLVLIAIFSLLSGQYPIDFGTLSGYFDYKLFGGTPQEVYGVLDNIIWQIRLPRVLLAILIGASLAVSGVAFQAMFVNPLVSPGILGVLAGASFGAAVGMLITEQWFVVQLLAFGFGFVAVAVAVGIGMMGIGSKSTVMLVLGGVISSALFTSLLSIVKYIADPYSTLPAIVYWLMGSLTMADISDILTVSIPMLLSILGLIVLGKYLDLLSLGEEEAKALGVNVVWIRFLTILFATLASSLSVVMAGIIGWIGLIIPHIVRMAVGPSHRLLMPLSALFGGIFLLVADTFSRLAFSVEVPIGILTSLIGIPVFVVVLRKARSTWN